MVALAAWSAGWNLHAAHALAAARGLPGAICTALGTRGAPSDEAPGSRPEAQCAVCAQFLAAAAPQQQLAAPAGLLGIAGHEVVVARPDAAIPASPYAFREARAPPRAA